MNNQLLLKGVPQHHQEKVIFLELSNMICFLKMGHFSPALELVRLGKLPNPWIVLVSEPPVQGLGWGSIPYQGSSENERALMHPPSRAKEETAYQEQSSTEQLGYMWESTSRVGKDSEQRCPN